MAYLLLIGGLIILIAGAEAFVRGASKLATLLGVRPLVIGLTVVAIGTSAPEIGISVNAALGGKGDIALGNVVGSNIFNVLVILGLTALITPLVVARRLVRLEVPVMIALSLLALLLCLDGSIGRIDGALLAAIAVGYLVFMVHQARRDAQADAAALPSTGAPLLAPPRKASTWVVNGLWIAVGLAALVLGSRWFVSGAVDVARVLGVSELVIGLTIVAAGTSLPEVATSIVAAVRGERDIAAGNVIGSNIFNIVLVLGAAGLVAPDGVAVAPAVLRFDLPVMIAVALACLPIFLSGHRIDRWEGALFLLGYAVYVGWLIATAASHPRWLGLREALFAIVLPLTAVTAAVIGWRWSHERRSALS